MIDEVLKRAAKKLVPSKGRTKDQRKKEIFLLLDYLMTQKERLIPLGIQDATLALVCILESVKALPDWQNTLKLIEAQASFVCEQKDRSWDLCDSESVLCSTVDGKLVSVEPTDYCYDVIMDDVVRRDPRLRAYLAQTVDGRYILRGDHFGHQETRVFSKEELIKHVFRDSLSPVDLYLLWVNYLLDVREGFRQGPEEAAA